MEVLVARYMGGGGPVTIWRWRVSRIFSIFTPFSTNFPPTPYLTGRDDPSYLA